MFLEPLLYSDAGTDGTVTCCAHQLEDIARVVAR